MALRLLSSAALAVFVMGYLAPQDVLVGNDRAFYWGQLTSVFYDGDLLLHDDLLANDNTALVKARMLVRIRGDGLLVNKFPFGIALADGLYVGPVVSLMRLLGRPRLDRPVVAATKLGALLKVFLLLVLLDMLIAGVFPALSGSSRGIVVASVFVGSPLLFYGFEKYGMSHLNSALFAALSACLCQRWLRAPTVAAAVGLGLAFGALVITHWQNALYALFAAAVLGGGLLRAPVARRIAMVRTGLAAAAAAGLVVLVQALAFYRQYDTFFRLDHGEAFFEPTGAQVLDFLFSGYHGLLSWSPVFGLGLLGLVAGAVRRRGERRRFALAGLLTVAATLWLDATVADWWSGASYGQRRASVLVPLFALGLAEVVSWPRAKRLRWGVLALTAAWALVTVTLFRSSVDDLAVAVAGRPSEVDLETRAKARGFALDREGFRHGRRDFAESLRLKLTCPLGSQPCGRADQAWGFALLAAFVLAIFAFRTWYPALAGKLERHGRTAAALLAAYALVFALGLGFTVTGVGDEVGPSWRRFLSGRISRGKAHSLGVPAAATVFVDAAAWRCAGGDAAAAHLLRWLEGERLTPLELAELDPICRAAAPPILPQVLAARGRRLTKTRR